MHTRYKDEAAGSYGFGTTDPTCLQGIRTGLQYLTGKEHQTYMPMNTALEYDSIYGK